MGAPEAQRHLSNAYELFIFVLTILSLVVMAVLILPVDDVPSSRRVALSPEARDPRRPTR